mgnify:CR=1 FL=1|jgi:hypothetical protein
MTTRQSEKRIFKGVSELTGCDDHDLKESGEYVVERPRADDRVARFLQTGHPVREQHSETSETDARITVQMLGAPHKYPFGDSADGNPPSIRYGSGSSEPATK